MIQRIILIPLCCAALIIFTAQAQIQSESVRTPTVKNVLKINPGSMLFGTFNIHYERRSSAKHSHQFELFFHSGKLYNESSVNGIGVTYNSRSYHGKKVSAGFYTQLYIRFQQYRGDISQDWLGSMKSDPDTKLNIYTAGYLLGYQFPTNSRFVIDLFAGPNVTILQAGNELLPFPVPFVRIGLTFGFEL